MNPTEAERRKAWADYYEACEFYHQGCESYGEMVAEAGMSWVCSGGYRGDAMSYARQEVGPPPVRPTPPPFPDPDEPPVATVPRVENHES
jgi:hypothetical protein